jgi:hypothetical protein
MTYTPKRGDVSIFANRFKDSDRKPDWKGEIIHPTTGEVLAIALWEKTGAKGKFFSGRVEIPREQTAKRDHSGEGDDTFRRGAGRSVSGGDRLYPDIDDEIPF